MNDDHLVTIRLRGVRATGFHGVFAFERREGQVFVVDADLEVRRPSLADDLTTTVDYGGLADALVADVERDPVDLIETLAGRLAETCLADPLVERVTVTVHKPNAPIAVPFGDVSVTCTRRKS
ncbi:MAG: dihydroneopterin aldolase [Propionibacteriaceae bacterium]|nr:dihydroneopterin aldolase [Propionibacteriaceae bacterium]